LPSSPPDGAARVGFGLLCRRAGPLLARAAALLRRHPAMGVAAGRLVGGVRTVTPVVAAWAGVRYPRFTAGDVPAALGWAGLLVSLGQVAGAALDEVRLAVNLLGLPLVSGCLIVHFGLMAIRVRWARSRWPGARRGGA
jgi:membrane-associated protein